MRFLLSMAVSVVTAVMLLSFLPVHGEAQIYEDVIRLHVLAVSDSAEDQAVKLRVRDYVLSTLTPKLTGVIERDEALQVIEANLAALETGIGAKLTEWGVDTTVQVTCTREMYPTRVYDMGALPAGEYLSLRVILGEGRGHNWWCVLFPTVCSQFAMAETVEDEYQAVGFTPEEYKLITHAEEMPYTVRFRLLELLESLFSRENL